MIDNLGVLGEKLTARELKKLGYNIIAANYKCPIGEIDLIAKDKDTLVFVEVRTRSSSKFGLPQETVNYRKQKKIRRVAEYYLVEHNIAALNCRFDVVGIVWQKGEEPQIEVIKDAF